MNKIDSYIPWKRYALITSLARRLSSKKTQFGKTALQKMVYLFQEIYNVHCGYNFELYTYGPFTSQLLHDLDFTEHIGGVEVCRVDSLKGGYEIVPDKEADYVLKKGEDFLNDSDVDKKLSQLIDNFGDFSATELELRSTIVYVSLDLKRNSAQPDIEEIVRVVKDIKPKFTIDDIRLAVEELEQKNFINIAH